MGKPSDDLGDELPKPKPARRSRFRSMQLRNLGYPPQTDLVGRLDRVSRRKPREGPEGLTLRDTQTAWSWPKFLIGAVLALAWNAGTWTVVSMALRFPRPAAAPHGEGGSSGLICAFSILIFAVLIGIGALLELARWTRNAWKLQPARLVLPRWPLRLGESVRVTYHRPFRRDVVHPGELRARLVCMELVFYWEGTERQSTSAPVWDEELPLLAVPAGSDGAHAEWVLRIPPEGAPSFRARSNRILWGLEILLRVPGAVTGHSTFALQVAPEVVA
jgi:hypothetical protein